MYCWVIFFRQTCKKDKGAAMTLVYKEVAWEHPLISNDKSLLLAADGNTQKVLMHEKYKPKSKETTVSLPLVIIVIDNLSHICKRNFVLIKKILLLRTVRIRLNS